MDLTLVRIEYKNGLSSSINLIRTGTNNKRLERGGGNAPRDGGYKRIHKTGGANKSASEMEISNNKVLIFAPYFNEF
jgi:hypothetical protein